MRQVDKSGVNRFALTKLWTLQTVQEMPAAISEEAFIIPQTVGGAASSAEGRRNYTDLQETAQWLGGTSLPKCILQDLKGDNPMVVVNATLYDGCLEAACLDMGIATVSQSERMAHFQTGIGITKKKLLELWKASSGALSRGLV